MSRRGKQIYNEAQKIIDEAKEKGAEDNPIVNFSIILTFTLGAKWADKNPYWRSVEEVQPKEDEWFLGYSPLKSPLSSMKIDVYNFDSNGLIEAHGITHWMPLPAPPKGGEK